MLEAAKVIDAIARTSSTSQKLALLKQYGDVRYLKDILKFIYNPYCKTGISNAKLAKAMQNWPTGVGKCSGEHAITLPKMIEYFQEHKTGDTQALMLAREFIWWYESTQGPKAKELAIAVVTQNLTIGVTATSLNKVYGDDFIPKTGCMLGTPYGDVRNVAWPCIVTEKLDGVRRILIKKNGVCRFYSRSGHEDTGLTEVATDAKYLPNNFVYDGELLAIGDFKDSIAQRQATNSIANSKGIKKGLTFNVFDMVPVDEFYSGRSSNTALERKLRLGATLMDESICYIREDWARCIAAFGVYADLHFIKPVPILGMVNNLDAVTPIVEQIWSRGGEGVMLNTVNGLYEIKRSKQLLKIKHTEEYVLPVVDAIEGSGKYEDSLGALVVLYTDKQGNQSYLGVGSGFTDAQRKDVWEHPAKYRGRMVEIECFGESTNVAGTTSLNCPIFKRFVGEVE